MKPRSTRAAAALGLLFVVLVVYWPIISGGFIVDDDNYVYENETLRNVGGLARIWLDLESSPQYYPLVFSSFWLEYRIWGSSPQGYHISNVVLHAVNVVLLWLVLSRLSVAGAWVAAAVFAVHPVQVESVAWIAERKNVLSTVFYLLALTSFLRFSTSPEENEEGRSRRLLYGACLAFFVLALLSKTATLTLPVALLLILWWREGRVSRRDLLLMVPMLLIGFGFGLVTLWIETTRGGAAGELWDLSILERILVAARAVCFYAAKLFWPVELSFNYERWSVDSAVWWQYLYPLTLAALLGMLWAKRKELGRAPLVATLYFLVSLGPTLGFFDVYFFRYSYVADHFLYLASMGPIALTVGTAATWWRRQPSPLRIGGVVATLAVLATLGGLSRQRSTVFRDLEALCLDTLQKNPSSWLARNNLGNIYLERGEVELAAVQLEQAREVAPSYLETHLNLAIAYMNLGRFEEALASAHRSLEISPANHYGYKLLGDIYLRSGGAGEAVFWFREALKQEPEYLKARVGLGTALANSGRLEEAVTVLSKALEADPENATARANLASALARLGRLEEAIEHFETAMRFDPENPMLRRNLELARERAAAKARRDDER